MPAEPGRLSGLVVARGAATACIVAMPAAFFQTVLAGQEPKPKATMNLAFGLVLLGFAFGGWLAGKEAPGQVAKHGAFAALLAFVPVEIVAVLGRLDRGEELSLAVIIVTGLLAACCGTIGARLGSSRNNQGEPA